MIGIKAAFGGIREERVIGAVQGPGHPFRAVNNIGLHQFRLFAGQLPRPLGGDPLQLLYGYAQRLPHLALGYA